jgi:hypothetical protein
MATETIELESTPCEEECAQTIDSSYGIIAQAQCRAWKNQLHRFLESKGYPKELLPNNFRLVTKGNVHEFGTYYEVAVKFNDDCEKSWNLALILESEAPSHWDSAAKAELQQVSQ